jgi:hypothetical protein
MQRLLASVVSRSFETRVAGGIWDDAATASPVPSALRVFTSSTTVQMHQPVDPHRQQRAVIARAAADESSSAREAQTAREAARKAAHRAAKQGKRRCPTCGREPAVAPEAEHSSDHAEAKAAKAARKEARRAEKAARRAAEPG